MDSRLRNLKVTSGNDKILVLSSCAKVSLCKEALDALHWICCSEMDEPVLKLEGELQR